MKASTEGVLFAGNLMGRKHKCGNLTWSLGCVVTVFAKCGNSENNLDQESVNLDNLRIRGYRKAFCNIVKCGYLLV